MKSRPTTSEALRRPVTLLRAKPARGIKTDAAPAVEREGGDFGAGLIRGAAIVTRGEALGHNLWIDREFVTSVAAQINANPTGTKSRFAHPGLSGDGLGKALGRMRAGRVDGDIARADLHFFESAHETPSGDLAAYVMDLAEEDPTALAVSISFWDDVGAQDRHRAEHEDADGHFVSPDADNTQNYPHARLARLRAADVVDEPAANPGGLFGAGQGLVREAEALTEFVLGLRDEAPELQELEIDPERVAGFFARFMTSHGLRVDRLETGPTDGPAKEEIAMSVTKTETPAAQALAQGGGGETALATVQDLKRHFPDATAEWQLGCIEEGVTLWQAQERWRTHLEGKVRELDKALAARDAELKALHAEVFDLKAKAMAVPEAGGGDAVEHSEKPPTKSFGDDPEGWEREWSANPIGEAGVPVQTEFRGDKAAYIAFRKAAKEGRCRIFGSQSAE